MLARLVLLAGWVVLSVGMAHAAIPTPILQIELRETPAQVVLGSTVPITFSVRNLVSGTDAVYAPRYRLSGTTANFEGDTQDVFHANFFVSDTVGYQLRAVSVGRINFALSIDYVECNGTATCSPKTITQTFLIEVVPVAPASTTATPTGTRATSTPGGVPTVTPTPVTGLLYELSVSPPQPIVGDMVTFTFTVTNLQRDVIAQRPEYRLSGLLPNYDWNMAAVTHDVSLRTGDRDTVQYTFRALKDGEALVRIRADYLECRAAQCTGGFAQSDIFPVVTRGSALTPISTTPASASATPTLIPGANTPTTTLPALSPTATATPSPVTGLTIELAVFPAQPVVGDLVSFVFTVRNLQSGVVAQRPTYSISGLLPNYEGELSAITRDVSIAGPQTDTVQYTVRAVRDGISDVRLLINYLECRGSQCGGAFSASNISPLLTRGSRLTPLVTATLTFTPTSTISPAPIVTATSTVPITATSTMPVAATSTASPTATASPEGSLTPTRTTVPSVTRTPTAGVVTTPTLTFAIEVDPPEPMPGENVAVKFTISNLQGPATLRRETYVVSGASPNFDGNVMPVTHDVPILGQRSDTVTYQLRAVNEGVTLFQIHVTYEICGATLPCPFGASSSQIFAVSVSRPTPTQTPTMNTATPSPTTSASPGTTPLATATPTRTSNVTPLPMPSLTYELAVNPLQPLVGDDVALVFTIRNGQVGTRAERPNYQVTGATPNLEGSTVPVTHDVSIGGDSVDHVTYQLRAVHEGTTLLQLHTTYDTCVNDDPCSFGNSSSPIFRVVVKDPPLPTETVTPTATQSPSATPTPTTTVVRITETPSATPTPSETPHFVVIVDKHGCSISQASTQGRDALAPWLVAGMILWSWRRQRSNRFDDLTFKAADQQEKTR